MARPYMFRSVNQFEELGMPEFPDTKGRIVGTQIVLRNTADVQTSVRFIAAYVALDNSYDFVSVEYSADGTFVLLESESSLDEASFMALLNALPNSMRVTDIDATAYDALLTEWTS